MKTYNGIQFVQVENEPQSLIFAKRDTYEAFPNEDGGFDIRWLGCYMMQTESIEAFIDHAFAKGLIK